MVDGTQKTWTVLLEHEAYIRRVFRSLNPYLEDDLWSDVALVRGPRIISMYDPNHPSKATLKTYLVHSLALYARKFIAKERQRALRNTNNPENYDSVEVSDVANRELVNSLLERLPKLDRSILFMRFYMQLEFQAIADRLNCKRGMAQHHYYKALKSAKDILTLKMDIHGPT